MQKENQVAKFQRVHDLIEDGIIGKKTADTMATVWGLTYTQLAHFLGQCAHESLNFTRSVENTSYSSERLLQVFRKYFTPAAAELYEHKPRLTARFVYADRMGNGGIDTVDGWLYRGHGVIMLTGKDNYIDFANYVKDIDVIQAPELLRGQYYFDVGLYFFEKNKISDIATDFEISTINAITKRINGGYNEIADRKKKTMYYKGLLGL